MLLQELREVSVAVPAPSTHGLGPLCATCHVSCSVPCLMYCLYKLLLHAATCCSKSHFRLQFPPQKYNKIPTYFYLLKTLYCCFFLTACLPNSVLPSQFISSSLQHIPVYGADTLLSTAGISNEGAAEVPALQDFMESAPENASHKEKDSQSKQAIKQQLVVSTSARGGSCRNTKDSQTNSGETE